MTLFEHFLIGHQFWDIQSSCTSFSTAVESGNVSMTMAQA